MHAEITAYRGKLIFNLKVKKSIKNEVITKLDNKHIQSHIIINTKKNLGISKEALILLKSIMRAKDSSGTLDWSKSLEGVECFGWKGEAHDIKSPSIIEASKNYKILSYKEIPNNVPIEAIKAIENIEKKYGKLIS